MEPAEYRLDGAVQERPRRLGILFDKDGTLFDFHRTWSGWTRSLIDDLAGGDRRLQRRLGAALGFDLDLMQFQRTSPAIAGTPDVVVDAIRQEMPHLEASLLRARLIHEAAHVRPVEAAPLRTLLPELSDLGYVLGVATNDAEAVARVQLEEVGALGCFSFVAGYDSGYGAKPGTGMLSAFCECAAISPERAVMVGDSEHDLVPARELGMAAVAVLSGPAVTRDLAPFADAVLEHVGFLPHWLRAQRRPTDGASGS